MTATRLNTFIERLHQVMDRAGNDEDAIRAQAEPLLRELIAHDDWLQERYAIPHPEFYQQYCLYVCPRGQFSIVSFVWGPGQQTPIHDHTVWGLIGMLRGAEIGQRFTLRDNGALQPDGEQRLDPGMVDFVSPRAGDIHRVSNAHHDQVSISIHVYGADIGKVKRHVYKPDTAEVVDFISGYAQAAIGKDRRTQQG